MLALLFSRQGGIVAGAVAVLALLTFSHVKAYHAGAASVRQAMLERSVELLRERNASDEIISDLDDAGLCAALGGLPVGAECQ